MMMENKTSKCEGNDTDSRRNLKSESERRSVQITSQSRNYVKALPHCKMNSNKARRNSDVDKHRDIIHPRALSQSFNSANPSKITQNRNSSLARLSSAIDLKNESNCRQIRSSIRDFSWSLNGSILNLSSQSRHSSLIRISSDHDFKGDFTYHSLTSMAADPSYSFHYNRNSSTAMLSSEVGLIEDRKSKHKFTKAVPVLLETLFGIVLGIIFNYIPLPKLVVICLKAPGHIFIQLLTALLGPITMTTVILSINELFATGKAMAIWVRLIFLFSATSFLAVLQACISLYFLYFNFRLDYKSDSSMSGVHILCSNGYYLKSFKNGNVQCSPKNNTIGSSQKFVLQCQKCSDFSLSKQLVEFSKHAVPGSIIDALVDGNLIGLIMFAIFFGLAIGECSRRKRNGYGISLLKHLNQILQHMLETVLLLTPIAIVSLIIGPFLSEEVTTSNLKNTGFLFLSMILPMMSHMFIVMPLIFYYYTKTSPFAFLKAISPAQTFAFGSSSSESTIPITMQCLQSTKKVSLCLMRLVVAPGAVVNKDGTCIYLMCIIIYLIQTSDEHVKELSGFKWVLICVSVFFSSVTGPPVPKSGLTMTLTVWYSTISTVKPEAFFLISALDWVFDRFATALNVTGDCWITMILAEQIDETYLDEVDRQEECS